MTPAEIDLVQGSFAKVAPIADSAADLFYARLLEIAPEVQPMFTGDMSDQGAKLMATLGVVVNGLTDLDAIVPVAERLAVKHVDYGVTAAHYAPVGAPCSPRSRRVWATISRPKPDQPGPMPMARSRG